VTSKHLRELEPGERRRAVARSATRMAVGVLALLGLYAVAPVDGLNRVTEGVWLVLGLLAVAAVFAWQIRAIVKADYPGLLAVESTVLTVTLFLVVFSLIYLSLSKSNTANFSESLDRVSAFYFAVTLLATVGFGDISARTDGARIFVTLQMLLDLTLIVVVVKAIFGSARTVLKGSKQQ
jgi:Ion channel